MRLATVIGPVYSVVHHPAYAGRTLLCVVPEDAEGPRERRGFLAVDMVGAGQGDRVLVGMPTGYAAEAFDYPEAPIRSLVLAVVDSIRGGSSR